MAGVAEELATLAVLAADDQAGRAAEGGFDLGRAGEIRRAVDPASRRGEGEPRIEPSEAAHGADDTGSNRNDRPEGVIEVRHRGDWNEQQAADHEADQVAGPDVNDQGDEPQEGSHASDSNTRRPR